MRFSITPHAWLWFALSGSLVVISLILLLAPGLKLGIDFTGGTLMEISFETEIAKDQVQESLQDFAKENESDIGIPSVLRTDKGGYIIRLRDISNEEHLALQDFLRTKFGSYDEHRFTTIGPTVGSTLKVRSFWAILTAAIVMVLYIAFAFRNVPKKLSPWKFGFIAVLALIHDLVITMGVFVIIGRFTIFEVDTLFITALLIILGYSVNDTIVIFDRVRENVFKQSRGEEISTVAERGLMESMARSFNTSFSTLIPLFALFFLGGDSIRWFVLTLIVGLLVGTYSSIFIATPLLVFWRNQR